MKGIAGTRFPLWLLSVACILFTGCASYNKQARIYYDELVQGDYGEASKKLDHTRLLKKKRNRLLYLLEKGKTEHLRGNLAASNRYFNEADALMERYPGSLKDYARGTLLNPMMTTYTGEDFEKYMVHYYKALNYLALNQPDEALVEARRISLRKYAQEDKAGQRDRYAGDPFALMLQGMIYEKNGAINDAFIAYRNAAELYTKGGGNFYGTQMPLQLQHDLLRSAYLNGFEGDLQQFEKQFGISYTPDSTADALILFWENGRAPVKIEKNISLVPTHSGNQLFFTNDRGDIRIPFYGSASDAADTKWAALASFRVALPGYQPQPLTWHSAVVEAGGKQFSLQPVHNINDLAMELLHERWLREASLAVSRAAAKKLAQVALAPKEKEKDKEETKKEGNKRAALTVASAAVGVFQYASEKADTRNWQSLPHSIYFVRIPLQKGLNKIRVDVAGTRGTSKAHELVVENRGGLQFRNLCTLQQ